MACLMMSGAMRTAPTAALEVLFSLTPIHLYIEQEAMLTALRLYKGGSWVHRGTVTGHATILSNLLEKFTELDMPVDRMPSQFCFEKPFEIKFPTRLDWEDDNIQYEEDAIILFTDGSKTDESSGQEFFALN